MANAILNFHFDYLNTSLIIIMVYKVSARRSLVERRIGQKVSYLTRSEQDRLTSGPNVLLGFLKDRETGF